MTVELDYPDGTSAQLTGRTGSTGAAVVIRHVTETGTYTFVVLNVIRPPAAVVPGSDVPLLRPQTAYGAIER